MKEHQILYSKAMILAKLDGRKTVTRRPVKIPEWLDPYSEPKINNIGQIEMINKRTGNKAVLGDRYGIPNDRLYTKENFSVAGCNPSTQSLLVEYRADENFRWVQLTDQEWEKYDKWKQPSGPKSKLFMFRSLSRFLDEITEVKVERVQDITPRESWDEGVRCGCMKPTAICKGNIDAFKNIWQSMYEGGEFDWHNNPWVWVIRYTPLVVNQAENQDVEFEVAQ